MDLLYKMRHRDTTGQISRQLCIHPLHIIRTMAHSKALAVWWCLTLWFMILLQLATSRRDFSQLSKVKLNLRKYSTSQMVLPRSTRIEKTLLILLTMRRITEYQQNGISLPHHTAKVRVTELVVQWKDLRPRLACKEHLTVKFRPLTNSMSGLRITLLELQPYSAPRVTLLNMKHFWRQDWKNPLLWQVHRNYMHSTQSMDDTSL